MNPPRIAIIGGGAAGMMCAATLLEHWQESASARPEILLFEKNSRLGAKVIISGGGRCNVTTGTFKRKELLTHYTRGADFLDYSFRQFGPKKVRQRFEDHGVPLKQEADGRIFPVSDDGKDIVGVFEKLFNQHKVSIKFKETVQAFSRSDDGLYTLTTQQDSYVCNAVVVATGGEAYAHTGSTGDGYSFARAVGHTITQLGPSLNSFMVAQEWLHACTGISFEHARLEAVDQPPIGQSGPVLLTHFGLSGPHTFVLASHTAWLTITPEQPLQVLFTPDIEHGYAWWEERLLHATAQSPKKQLQNILSQHLPKRFVESYCGHLGLPHSLTMAQLNKQDRKLLSSQLGQGIPLTLTKRRPGDEFVTAGGVATDEVNPHTMESLLSPGLYFTGEVLNIDGVTGGYNLQSSWATGRMAGLGLVEIQKN